MRFASLFAGIGGIDLGLERAGHECALLCECHPDAQTVLRAHFPGVPLHDDVRTLEALPPDVSMVCCGSPCCDFSQANPRQDGLDGPKSSLMLEILRVLGASPHVSTLVFENVTNMIFQKKGAALRRLCAELEALGFAWAYRVVDARCFGLRQRRRRLVLVADRRGCPAWLVRDSFAEEADTRPDLSATAPPDGFEYASFYWVDGSRGCGWTVNGVPTIRAHDTPLYIPSEPAVMALAEEGGASLRWRLTMLHPEDGERLQGFPEGWTECLPDRRRFARIGNAAPPPLFEWVGKELAAWAPGADHEALAGSAELPTPLPQACTSRGAAPGCTRWVLPIGARPAVHARIHGRPLSQRAIRGFLKRAAKHGKSGMPEWALAVLREALG